MSPGHVAPFPPANPFDPLNPAPPNYMSSTSPASLPCPGSPPSPTNSASPRHVSRTSLSPPLSFLNPAIPANSRQFNYTLALFAYLITLVTLGSSGFGTKHPTGCLGTNLKSLQSMDLVTDAMFSSCAEQLSFSSFSCLVLT